jgi:RhtB (resistance to homoserine/threonine) family protein
MELALVFTVIGVHLLAVISPGPDLVMAIRNSLTYSRKTGIWTAVGFGLGIAVHIAYSLAGLALIISQSIIIFNIIKYIGAAYLIYIGARSLFAKDGQTEVQLGESKEDISALSAVKTGFLTNVLNPKATIFFLSLFTMIISPETSFLTLGIASLVMIVNTVLWFSLVAVIFTHKRTRNVYNKFQGVINKSFGAILVALGVKIALTNQ